MKQIENYSGYFITQEGEVYSTKKGGKLRMLKPFKAGSTDKNQYKVIALYDEHKVKDIHYIHRLVYSAFMGAVPDGSCIRHIDGNHFNNRLENLEVI